MSKLIILGQLIIIVLITILIYSKKHNTRAQISISPINKNSVQKINSDELQSIWQVPPNQIATFSAYFLKKPITYQYNQDGLSDSQNYSIQKDPSTFRIVALGDSFTFGIYVPTQNNWTEILEKKLNEKPICKNISKFEIINLGSAGYDPQYEVTMYRDKGQKYNPDLILWMLVQPERLNEIQIPLLTDCLQGQSSMDIDNQKDKDKFTNCVKSSIDIIKQKYTPEQIYTIQSNNINKISQYYNQKIVFIDFWNNHQPILDKLKNINFSSLNFNQEFKNQNTNHTLQFPDSHPNQLGHQVIANILFKQLFATNQIPCMPLQ